MAEKPSLEEVDIEMTDLFMKQDALNESCKEEEEGVKTEQMIADDASCCHQQPEDNISQNSTQFPGSEHNLEEDEAPSGMLGRSFLDFSTCIGSYNDEFQESTPCVPLPALCRGDLPTATPSKRKHSRKVTFAEP